MSSTQLLLALFVTIALLPAAHAQYQWRDANGRMVFSDMPPPPGLKPGSLLKAPAPRSAVADASSDSTAAPTAGAGEPVARFSDLPASADAPASIDAPSAVPPAASRASPPQTAADREMAWRKRQLEQAQARRKADEQEAAARKLAGACAEQRAAMRLLESGTRLARVNERGEREILDDAQRAAQLENARRVAREHCSAS